METLKTTFKRSVTLVLGAGGEKRKRKHPSTPDVMGPYKSNIQPNKSKNNEKKGGGPLGPNFTTPHKGFSD